MIGLYKAGASTGRADTARQLSNNDSSFMSITN
jgi:hypothetical protein